MRWRSFRRRRSTSLHFDDGAALAGAFDAREEPDRVVEQRRGARMGEQLGADEPQHRRPEARGLDQPRAHGARRLGSCGGWLACSRIACGRRPSAHPSHRTRRGPRHESTIVPDGRHALLRGDVLLNARRDRRRVGELFPAEARDVVRRRSRTARRTGTARAPGASSSRRARVDARRPPSATLRRRSGRRAVAAAARRRAGNRESPTGPVAGVRSSPRVRDRRRAATGAARAGRIRRASTSTAVRRRSEIVRTPTRVRTSIVSARCGIVGRVTTTSASTGIPASTHVRIARSAVLSAPGCPTSQSCASRRAQWNGTLSRCTPADRSCSTTALVRPAPAVQRPRFSGRSSTRSWRRVGRSARRSGSPPPIRKAPGRPATARAARRTSLAASSSSSAAASPRATAAGPDREPVRDGDRRLASQRTGTRRPRACFARRRRIVEAGVHLGDIRPVGDGYHIRLPICQDFPARRSTRRRRRPRQLRRKKGRDRSGDV